MDISPMGIIGVVFSVQEYEPPQYQHIKLGFLSYNPFVTNITPEQITTLTPKGYSSYSARILFANNRWNFVWAEGDKTVTTKIPTGKKIKFGYLVKQKIITGIPKIKKIPKYKK